jgi:hypothetical protein
LIGCIGGFMGCLLILNCWQIGHPLT